MPKAVFPSTNDKSLVEDKNILYLLFFLILFLLRDAFCEILLASNVFMWRPWLLFNYLDAVYPLFHRFDPCLDMDVAVDHG